MKINFHNTNGEFCTFGEFCKSGSHNARLNLSQIPKLAAENLQENISIHRKAKQYAEIITKLGLPKYTGIGCSNTQLTIGGDGTWYGGASTQGLAEILGSFESAMIEQKRLAEIWNTTEYEVEEKVA